MNPLFAPARADLLDRYAALYTARARAIREPRHTADVERWRPLVEKYWAAITIPILQLRSPARWLDVEGALEMVFLESRGNPDAVNSGSGAAGLFQHLPRLMPFRLRSAAQYFDGLDAEWFSQVRADHADRVSPLDPEASVAAAAWLRGVQGWAPWSPFISGKWKPYTLTMFWDGVSRRYGEAS